jgi:hypothetical protein
VQARTERRHWNYATKTVQMRKALQITRDRM